MVTDARHRLATVKQLPYDAEIEFLESTGTQYIDTGTVFTPQSSVLLDVEFTTISTGSVDAQHNGFIKGSDSGNFRVAIGCDTNQINIYAASLRFSINADLKRHTLSVDYPSKLLKIDDSTQSISDSLTGTFSYPFFLFARNESGVATLFCHQKLYGAKISVSNVLVRDLIPVRFTNELGQSEGAMYDKVSGQLFRNQGSGEFVLGPDVAPAPYVVTYRKPFVSFTPPPPPRLGTTFQTG